MPAKKPPAKSAAAKNKGGRPPGGLRSTKPSQLYQEAFAGFRARVEAIDDPLKRVELVLDLLVEATLLTVEGKGHAALNKEIRAFATSIRTAIPLARIARAEQLIRDDSAPARPQATTGGGAMRKPKGGRKPLRKG